MTIAPTPNSRNRPVDRIDEWIAASIAALDAGDVTALAAIEACLSDADRTAMLERVIAELARRQLGGGFSDDDMPTDFRVTAILRRPGSAGVVVRAMHIDRDEHGAELSREIEALDWQEFGLGTDCIDLATADEWLTEAGYLRTTEWSARQTTTRGTVVCRADAITGLSTALADETELSS
jgi:hypothetical protein